MGSRFSVVRVPMDILGAQVDIDLSELRKTVVPFVEQHASIMRNALECITLSDDPQAKLLEGTVCLDNYNQAIPIELNIVQAILGSAYVDYVLLEAHEDMLLTHELSEIVGKKIAGIYVMVRNLSFNRTDSTELNQIVPALAYHVHLSDDTEGYDEPYDAASAAQALLGVS